MTRKPDADPDEPTPPGGHAAERLRQFERARGWPARPGTPANPQENEPGQDPPPDAGRGEGGEGDGGDKDDAR